MIEIKKEMNISLPGYTLTMANISFTIMTSNAGHLCLRSAFFLRSAFLTARLTVFSHVLICYALS